MKVIRVKFKNGQHRDIGLNTALGDSYEFSEAETTVAVKRHSTKGMMVPTMLTGVASVSVIESGADPHPSRDSYEKK